MQVRTRLNITEFAALLSLLVGSSFATFVVISTGYFQIVAPAMLGWFLEANLLQGAALSIPYVVIATTGIVPLIFIRSRLSIFIRRSLSTRFPNLNPLKVHLIRLLIILVGFASCYIGGIYTIYINSDKFYLVFTIISLLFTILFTEFIYGIRHKLDNIGIYCAVPFILLSLYYFLYFSGMAMAVESLGSNNSRYNIYTKDKTYINALVINATSNTVIIRIGNEILFFDRANIKRLERIYNRDSYTGARSFLRFYKQ